MAFGSLPTELIFSIFHHLPLQSLHALQRTSRQWNDLFVKYESIIYHNAALYHGFVASMNVTLDEAKSAHLSRSSQDIRTWRALCKWCFLLESNWVGYGQVTTKVLSEDRNDVHRVKVDERVGILITTHQDGGLVVRDLETDELLWCLPRTYVRNYAHCEYDNGFLIFDRFGQSKEVWRLASEYTNPPTVIEPRQEDIAFTAGSLVANSKGKFKPWSILTSPELGRAFRFVYPNLLVASYNKLYLYDVETAQLVCTIENIQAQASDDILGDINYVEISKTHVFVCGTFQLRVFNRDSRTLALHIPSLNMPQVGCRFVVHPPEEDGQGHPVKVVTLVKEEVRTVYNSGDAEFIAVHVSSDGQTFVALVSDGRVLIVKDLFLLLKGEKTFLQCTTEISFACCRSHYPLAQPTSIYLAYEFGRVGIITTGGVFVLTLDPTEHALIDPELQVLGSFTSTYPSKGPSSGTFPYFLAARILPFNTWRALRQVSCIQMTETRVLWTWDYDLVTALNQSGEAVPGVDFPVMLDGEVVDFDQAGAQEDVDDDWENEWPPLVANNHNHNHNHNHNNHAHAHAHANHNVNDIGNDGMMNLQQWLEEERSTRRSVVMLDFAPVK